MMPPWMHHFAAPQARTLRNRHAMQPALSTPAVIPAIESRLYDTKKLLPMSRELQL
ncbi:hypothetical protein BVI2075_210030 [Burkholderia vietnamiensis]|nr:hypothetical protein BVI2075_210030 [Burkholderia vietnamiensis]